MHLATQTTRYRLLLAGLIALTLALVAMGCSSPIVPTVKQYQNDGVQFSYYSDWRVAKDAPVDGKPTIRSIQIEGPGHAVISLICEPSSSAQSLEQFADAVAKNRGAAIESRLNVGGLKTAQVSLGTSNPTTGNVAGRGRQGIQQEFSIKLLGQEVPHQARFYVVEGTKYKIMIMSQVSNENARRSQAGSELVLKTMSISGAQ